MAQVTVSDLFTDDLQAIANQSGRGLSEVVEEAFRSYLSEHARLLDSELSPAQIERLQESLTQAKSGNIVTQEEVEAFFEDWTQEFKAR